MDNGLTPEWIDSLLTTLFFFSCTIHRKICNVFCTDCPQAGPLCTICRSVSHPDHHTIQIRKFSTDITVNIAEVRKLMDISDVQHCNSKGARVVYITSGISEPKLKSCCVVCLKKPVNEEYKFCSLSCKVLFVHILFFHKIRVRVNIDYITFYCTQLERVKLIGDCCFTVDEAERLAETYVAEQRRGRRGAN